MIFKVIILSTTAFLLFWGRISILALILLILFSAGILLAFKDPQHGGYSALLSIDTKARASRLSPWPTEIKVGFGLGFAFLSILSQEILTPASIFVAMTFLILVVGKTKPSHYLSMLNIPVLFIALSALGLLVAFSLAPQGVINIPFFKGFLVVTEAAQANACLVIVRAVSALSCLYFISLTTPVSQLMALLKRLKFPKVIISLMYLIYRYIFVLFETYDTMRKSSASRLGYANYFVSVRTSLSIAANLFFISLRKASDNFMALESRCFDGEIAFLEQEEKSLKPALLPLGLVLIFVITINLLY